MKGNYPRSLVLFCPYNYLCSVFTMDVTSLYIVIPNNEGFQALKHGFVKITEN